MSKIKGRPDLFLGGKLLLILKKPDPDHELPGRKYVTIARCVGHSRKRGGRLSCMQRGMKHPFIIPEQDALAIVTEE